MRERGLRAPDGRAARIVQVEGLPPRLQDRRLKEASGTGSQLPEGGVLDGGAAQVAGGRRSRYGLWRSRLLYGELGFSSVGSLCRCSGTTSGLLYPRDGAITCWCTGPHLSPVQGHSKGISPLGLGVSPEYRIHPAARKGKTHCCLP